MGRSTEWMLPINSASLIWYKNNLKKFQKFFTQLHHTQIEVNGGWESQGIVGDKCGTTDNAAREHLVKPHTGACSRQTCVTYIISI